VHRADNVNDITLKSTH